MKQREIDYLTPSERVAIEYICKNENCKIQDITRGKSGNPDFIAPSGKRYEAKRIPNGDSLNFITFSLSQIQNLKDNDIILVVKEKIIVTTFLWSNRKIVPLQTSIKSYKNTVESIKSCKNTGDSIIQTVELKEIERKRGLLYIPKTLTDAVKDGYVKSYVIRIIKEHKGGNQNEIQNKGI